MQDKQVLTLGHSPDPDDAFMFYALANERIDTGKWAFEHVLQDIQTLNDRALRAELDITAISIHAYPYVAKDYALTTCGSSMGDGYGPLVVARQPMSVDDLKGKTVLIPGEMTTAFLALNLLLGKGAFDHRVVMFDQILDAVQSGEADAGLIIHEGQLTYGNHDLCKVVDLGEWWKTETDLPLPLGGNCIRRSLGDADMAAVTGILKESITHGLEHRDQAVGHALRYARDMGHELADRFVGMYVNDWTIDYGPVGQKAVVELLRRGAANDLVPAIDTLDFIAPAVA